MWCIQLAPDVEAQVRERAGVDLFAVYQRLDLKPVPRIRFTKQQPDLNATQIHGGRDTVRVWGQS